MVLNIKEKENEDIILYFKDKIAINIYILVENVSELIKPI